MITPFLVEVYVQEGDAVFDRLSAHAIATTDWETWFHRWITVLQPTLSANHAYELSLRLTDDEEMQTLNQQYRQQNKPTDVLAFAALETTMPQFDLPLLEAEQSPQSLYLGDIVISVDTAQQQAQHHTLELELVWLAAHGLLHLLGWDHPDDPSLLRMLDQQRVLLQAIGLEAPVI